MRSVRDSDDFRSSYQFNNCVQCVISTIPVITATISGIAVPRMASRDSPGTLLLYGQVYEFATSPDQRGKPKGKIAKILLSPRFLNVVREEEIESPEVRKVFKRALEICRMRLSKLIVKVKSKSIFQNHPETRNDVFLDLADREF